MLLTQHQRPSQSLILGTCLLRPLLVPTALLDKRQKHVAFLRMN